MTRRTILVLLLGLNLFLLGTLVLSVSSPPAAMAQGIGASGNYILVAGQIERNHDAVYLFDLRNRLLHAFRMSKGRPVIIQPVDTRELTRDFRARG